MAEGDQAFVVERQMIDNLAVIPPNLGRGAAALIAAADEVALGGKQNLGSKWIQTECYPDGRIVLRYSRHFRRAPEAARREMLEHEAGHITDDTFGRCGERDKELWNIAVDCAINHHLNRALLPKGSCFYDSLGIPVVPAEVA